MTPLTKFWATISQEIEPEISCGLLEKVACQFLSIDKPLFRQSRVRRNSVPPDLLKGSWGPMKSPGENPGAFHGSGGRRREEHPGDAGKGDGRSAALTLFPPPRGPRRAGRAEARTRDLQSKTLGPAEFSSAGPQLVKKAFLPSWWAGE